MNTAFYLSVRKTYLPWYDISITRNNITPMEL